MKHTLDYTGKPPSYTIYKTRANERFPEIKMISESKFVELTAKECHYCGKEGPNGIDRVDNSKGYILENCVPCCKHCNYVKGNLSINDFNTWKERFVRKQCK